MKKKVNRKWETHRFDAKNILYLILSIINWPIWS